MRDCFGFSIDQYLFFGGYPGSASLICDEERYQQYIQSAIVEATINKDILMDTPISKPALLRQTFELGAAYSGQLKTKTKMLGTLQDAGNTTTLAGYIQLLRDSGMLTGLQKYSIDTARRKFLCFARKAQPLPWKSRAMRQKYPKIILTCTDAPFSADIYSPLKPESAPAFGTTVFLFQPTTGKCIF